MQKQLDELVTKEKMNNLIEMNQLEFNKLVNKRNIVKFLQENPELMILPKLYSSCPIAQYLNQFRMDNEIKILVYENYTIVFRRYNVAPDRKFGNSRWVKKFIKFIDKLPDNLQAKDIIERVKLLKA